LPKLIVKFCRFEKQNDFVKVIKFILKGN